MITIWLGYLIAAAAASVLFVLAGYRSRRARGAAAPPTRHGLPGDPLWADPDPDQPRQSEPDADAGLALRLALQRLAPVVTRQATQIDIAAPSGMPVRMRAGPLADLLEDTLTTVLQAAPASHVLLTAARHGDHVHIAMTDDIPGADPALRLANLRPLIQRVALRGATLDVNARPAEGTTITLRLAAVQGSRSRPEPGTSRPGRAETERASLDGMRAVSFDTSR